jgi:hypothetical protein
MYEKPLAAIVKEYRYDPRGAHRDNRILEARGLLPVAAIEQMVPAAEPETAGDDEIALLCAIGKCDSSKLPAIRNVVDI